MEGPRRLTRQEHLPPAKLAGLLINPAQCLARAREIGPSTADLVGRLLGERPLDRLRTAQGILRLAHKFSPRRLEAACRRALGFEEISHGAIKRILVQGLDLLPPPALPLEPTASQPPLFARPWTDFFPQA